VLRQGTALPSPTPEFVLHAGDLVITVGTRAAIDHVLRILDGSSE
jgi:K+/H+ antiporter YhaU regulatory subunit KhtT